MLTGLSAGLLPGVLRPHEFVCPSDIFLGTIVSRLICATNNHTGHVPNVMLVSAKADLCSSLQGEETVNSNTTLEQRLHSLEQRHAKADTLLHVHAALLYELQAQLRNLSATVQRMSHRRACRVKVMRAARPLGMRDTLPPGTHATNTAVSCMLHHAHETLQNMLNTI